MKLIAGLGNPGVEYQATRHNVGFMTIDYLARNQETALQRQGFETLYGKGWMGSEAILLAKPQTYMNLSGRALARLLSYFKAAVEDLIVIHDDLDLPFGTVRVKKGGGSGGHKGLLSIVEYLDSSEFLRVRIGIGKPVRKSMVERYVLSPFSEDEKVVLPRIIGLACEVTTELVIRGAQSAMTKYHGKSIIDSGNPGEEAGCP